MMVKMTNVIRKDRDNNHTCNLILTAIQLWKYVT